MEFEVGDIVEAFGLLGEVVPSVHPEWEGSFAVRVRFENDRQYYFTSDGRLEDWHQIPLLKLISKKPKPFKWSGEAEVCNSSIGSNLEIICHVKILPPYFLRRCKVTIEEIVDE